MGRLFDLACKLDLLFFGLPCVHLFTSQLVCIVFFCLFRLYEFFFMWIFHVWIFFSLLPLLFQWSIPSKLMVHGRCITRKTGILGTKWTRQEKGRINARDRCARKDVLARPLSFARLNFSLSLAPWNAYQASTLETRQVLSNSNNLWIYFTPSA